MWKRLDPKIATSEKHSKLGFSSLTLWVMMLPHSDSQGRYWANAIFIKGQCMPLFDHVRLEQVEAALLELEKVGLIHLYDVGDGKRYLVFHDVQEFNPPGGLRYQKTSWPNPPEGICRCVSRRENDVTTTFVPSSLPSSSTSGDDGGVGEEEAWPPMPATPRGSLWKLFCKAKITGTATQKRQYFEAWLAQVGLERFEQILMEPRVIGKDVFAVQRWYFNDMLKEAK